MTWSIQIPYQSRDQTIADALASGVDRAIERGEDRDVVSMLLLQASEFRNMGALIDHVESLDADGRRQLLDRARKDAGLEASEDIDSRENFE
jgi:hypothetical protein